RIDAIDLKTGIQLGAAPVKLCGGHGIERLNLYIQCFSSPYLYINRVRLIQPGAIAPQERQLVIPIKKCCRKRPILVYMQWYFLEQLIPSLPQFQLYPLTS